MAHTYRVLVDDNFHYVDESERYTLGEFDSCEQAIAVCRSIVDRFLLEQYRPGTTAQQLLDTYKGFSDDPFVVSTEPLCRFSAWEYARRRCVVLCEGGRWTVGALLAGCGHDA
jgi:hypothetical protein